MGAAFPMGGQRIRKNRGRVGRKTDQRGQSSQLGIRQIDQQVPTCGSISTPFPDRRFFFRGPPAFPQAFDYAPRTQAASPQAHTTWSAPASSGKDGKGCRRACKKTRLACLLGSKVVSVPIQYTPASALATLRAASALA